MATTRSRSPFDQSGLAWQRRRYVNHEGDEMYSADTIMMTPDEDLFDEADESCTDSDPENGEQVFDDVTPNVVSQHNTAFKRYMEIRSDVARVASKIEDYIAVVDACSAGKLAGMLPEGGKFLKFSDRTTIMDYLCTLHGFLYRRVMVGMVNCLESLQEERKYEAFMDWWASSAELRRFLRVAERIVDRCGRYLDVWGYLDVFQELGLKVERNLLKWVFRFTDFRDNEEYRYAEVETLRENMWLDMMERALEDRLAKGHLTDEDEEIFWDLYEGEEFKDRESWVMDLLDHVEHQEIVVRTSLWNWPGENDGDVLIPKDR